MSQKVAILIDNLGTFGETPDEEREDILRDLRKEGLDPSLVWYGNRPPVPAEIEIDLLVVDFGAITASFSGGYKDWTGEVIGWAEDHPGSLVLLWSGMTADAVGYEYMDRQNYQDSMEKWAAWPDNVRSMFAGLSYQMDWEKDGDSVDWLSASYTKLQTWFDIDPTRTPAVREVEEAGPLVTPDADLLKRARDYDNEPEQLNAEIVALGGVEDPEKPTPWELEAEIEATPFVIVDEPPVPVELRTWPEWWVCPECGKTVSAKGFAHRHCSSCGDEYDDLKTHDAVPDVARRHALQRVIHRAVDDLTGEFVKRMREEVWTRGSGARLGQYGAQMGLDLINTVTRNVGLWEREEAAKLLVETTVPDVTGLKLALTALKVWLDEDPEQPGGWDHFGFTHAGEVVSRAVGRVSLSAHPQANRVWVGIQQVGDGKYRQSIRGQGLLAPFTETEVAAYRSAFDAAGFVVSSDWASEGGHSYEVDARVGPNALEGSRRGWHGLDKAVLPVGWR